MIELLIKRNNIDKKSSWQSFKRRDEDSLTWDNFCISIGKNKDFLSQSNLEGISLQYFNLEGANLEGANLQGADLDGLNLNNANLKGACLKKAWLCYADLKGANLEGTDLEGANLKKASIIGANLQGANLQEANLSNANLRNSNFEGVNLQGAKLINVKDANIKCAKLDGAIIWDGYLLGKVYAKEDHKLITKDFGKNYCLLYSGILFSTYKDSDPSAREDLEASYKEAMEWFKKQK